MKEIERLLNVMSEIREKCPWDAKQTHESLKRYLLEEAYETIEAIEGGDIPNLKTELGDLLLQIVFHSQIASEKEHFQFEDVVRSIADKMVDRHPHVFNTTKKVSAEEVQLNWEKTKHKSEKRTSILAGIPKPLPALLKAQRLQDKASSVGFDWKKTEDVLNKLREELDELSAAIKTQKQKQIEEEFGDVLFTLVNVSRFLGIISEEALQKASTKFTNRFKYIEQQFQNDPEKISQATPEELDALWEESKDYY